MRGKGRRKEREGENDKGRMMGCEKGKEEEVKREREK